MKYMRINDARIGYHVILITEEHNEGNLFENNQSEIEKILDMYKPQRVVGGHVSQNWGKYIELENGEGYYIEDQVRDIFYAGVDGGIPDTPMVVWHSENDSIIQVAARQHNRNLWSYGDSLLSRHELIKAAKGNTIFPW